MAKKILIVDDEKIARDRIKRLLQSFPESVALFEADNGINTLEQIKNVQPDVLLLDIQMPVMSGFDVLFQLNSGYHNTLATSAEKRNIQVIFQTAFDEFAVKAFEVNACDYILKPFTAERLFQALRKAFARTTDPAGLKMLEKHLEQSQVYLKTVISKSGSQSKILKVDDIQAFKSEDHYTFAITKDAEYILDNSLNWLEEKLDPRQFVRGHRNNLLNIGSIEKIGSSENSLIVLTSGITLPLSRDKRKKVLGLFKPNPF